MKYTILRKDESIVYIESDDIIIMDSQSALDFMMTVKYETGCSKIVLNKKNTNEEFFRLSSGLAGEVLQKFINYHTKLAIIGDFSKYTSKSLHDFLYECNKGNDFFFVETLDQAIEKLSATR